MFGGSKKPYTAITVQVDRLTSEQFEEDDVSGIFDLVEVIRLQVSGPTEAARALRKKLKYGDPHRQIRALVLLDGLIQNAGSKFQRTFADEPLLERLRLMARDDGVDPQVRQKCKVLFVQWANAYKGMPGLERVANLYKEFPKSQRPAAARQKVLRETDPFQDDEEEQEEEAVTRPPLASEARSHPQSKPQQPSPAPASPIRPVTLASTSGNSSFSNKFFKSQARSVSALGGGGKPFNLAKEKDNMTQAIAQASIASTNLLNGLQLVNREAEKVSENAEVARRFVACKQLRRRILYYIHHVESEQWIGSLVNANDELVRALTAHEIMDRSISDDSDSDADVEISDAGTGTPASRPQMAGRSLAEHAPSAAPPAKPPRPTSVPMPALPALKKPAPVGGEEEDEEDEEDGDNPFGDANAVATPSERAEVTWKEV